MVLHRWWRRAAAGAILALFVPVTCALAGPPESAASDAAETNQDRAEAVAEEAGGKASVRRIAAAFNFEEEDNPYPVPRHWLRAQDTDKAPRPAFPRFNQAEFDFAIAHSGTTSVKLPTGGGSTSLRLSSGVIPVFAEGDYAVTAWVRTSDLAHARAFVCARLLDQASQPVAGTEVRTEALQTRGEWTEVLLQLVGAPSASAYLQVELQLLQPRQFEPAGAEGAHRVWPEDLSGAAWFDDIVVYQLPRVEITTGAGANIVTMPEKPVMRILVRDFVGERLDGHLVVTDVDDRVIQDVRTPLATAGRPQEWIPKLPALGWYRVTLSVLGEKPDGTRYRVGGAEMSFLWVGSVGSPGARVFEGPRTDRNRFGIIADQVEADLRPSLAAVARATGTGFTTIPLWAPNISRERLSADVPAIGRTIDELSQAGQQVVVCIPTIPGEVLSEFRLDAADPLALADIDASRWMPFLQPILDRYGQRLTRWQIGRTGTDGAFWRPEVVAAAQRFGAQLATLVPGPRVSIPWRAEYAFPTGFPDGAASANGAAVGERAIGTLVVSYPAPFGVETVQGFVKDLIARASGGTKGTPRELVIVPELPDADLYGERAAVTELARRTIEFWAARTAAGSMDLPVGLGVSHPWRRMGEQRPQLMPSASLGALRTLIGHLSERTIVGEYKLTPGVKCYILADRSAGPGARVSGALVAWNESAAPEDAVIRRFLGDSPVEVVDIFGNRTPVKRSGETGGPHVVRMGETPVFIEGADPMLAAFCTQLRVEPSFLPAVQTEHELSLVITNPWPQAISGKLQIVPPDGGDVDGEAAEAGRPGAQAGEVRGRRRWQVTPDGIIPFSLGTGQTKRLSWTAAFPYFEETGQKHFSVVVRLATNRELPPIVLPLTLQVGLQDLALEPDVQLGPRFDGPDVILTATVSNRGERSRMLKLDAVAAGFPTQQTVITDLPPGEVVIKRIVLKDAAALLSGKRVHLSLSDSEEQERLNTSVRVP